MSKILFVNRDGISQPRWKIAFPDSQCEKADSLPVAGTYRLLFCDISGAIGVQGERRLTNALKMGVPVVVMDAAPDPRRGVLALQMGARGYCHAMAAPSQLEQVAQVVLQGGYWLGPELVQVMVKTRVERRRQVNGDGTRADSVFDTLTPREREVAELLATGASNRTIAIGLNITERTVKAHMASLFEKFGVHDRVQLALRLNRR